MVSGALTRWLELGALLLLEAAAEPLNDRVQPVGVNPSADSPPRLVFSILAMIAFAIAWALTGSLVVSRNGATVVSARPPIWALQGSVAVVSPAAIDRGLEVLP